MLRASPPIHAHLVAREASYWDDHPLPFVLPENLRRVYKTLVWSTNFNGWWACRSILGGSRQPFSAHNPQVYPGACQLAGFARSLALVSGART